MEKTVHGVRFTNRQWQVAQLVSKAFLCKQIAHELGLAQGTVKQYMNQMYNAMRKAHPEINGLDMRIILTHWVAEEHET